jgi:hypothetical protein
MGRRLIEEVRRPAKSIKYQLLSGKKEVDYEILTPTYQLIANKQFVFGANRFIFVPCVR